MLNRFIAILGSTLGQMEIEIRTRDSESTRVALAILGYTIVRYKHCFLFPDPVVGVLPKKQGVAVITLYEGTVDVIYFR